MFGPLKYPKLNFKEVSIISVDIPNEIIYVDIVNLTKIYVNKKVYFSFQDVLYNANLRFSTIGDVSTYWLEDVSDITIFENTELITDAVLDCFETFSVSDDNELVTIQDILDFFITTKGKYTLNNSKQLISEFSKNSKHGLLSVMDKTKIDQTPFLLKSENIELTHDYSEIFKFKVDFETEILDTVTNLILRDDDNNLIFAEIKPLNNIHAGESLLFSININSFSSTHKLIFRFDKLLYADNSTYISVNVKLHNDIVDVNKSYELYIGISNPIDLISPVDVPTSGTISFAYDETYNYNDVLVDRDFICCGPKNTLKNQRYGSCGMVTLPEFTRPGDGTIIVGTALTALSNNLITKYPITEYIVPENILTVVDGGVRNYIVAKTLNNLIAEYSITTNINEINSINSVIVGICWRVGNIVHLLDNDTTAVGLSNKLLRRLFDTRPYEVTKEGGLILSETNTPNPFTVLISSAIVYGGAMPNNVLAFNSSEVNTTLTKFYVDTNGNPVFDSTSQVYDSVNINPYYVGGTGGGEIPAGNNKYFWRRFYRSIGDDKECYYVESFAEYNTAADAEASAKLGRNDIPDLINTHCLYIGFSVIQQGATSGTITPVILGDELYSGGAGLAVLPIATTTVLGGIRPDGTTIIVDPVTGIASTSVAGVNSKAIYVSSSAVANGNGSIVTPFQTIQEAITYCIGNGSRQTPQRQGITINVDSGTYTINHGENLAVNTISINLLNTDTIINYSGDCLTGTTRITPINYSSAYIPTSVVLQNITSAQTTLALFISGDAQAATCKYGALVTLNNGAGLKYFLCSDKNTVSSEYKLVTNTITTENYLFDYTGFSGIYSPVSLYGKGIIRLLGTGSLMVFNALYSTSTRPIIDCNITTVTSLLPLIKNNRSYNSSYLQGFTLNGSLTNGNGTGIYHDAGVSNTYITANITSSISQGSDSLTTRGYDAFLIFNTIGCRFAGNLSIIMSNYFFTLGSVGGTNNLGIFISGYISGCIYEGKQSIGLLNGRATFANNEKAGVYIQNLLINKQLTIGLTDSIFGSNTEIIRFAGNPRNFIIQNSSLRNTLSANALQYLGLEQTNSVPSVNRFGNDLYFNKIATANLPQNEFVIVIDANGKAKKVAVAEIKTPTVVVSETFYTTQTTVANFIANDPQASNITKSNLLSLVGGELYVLVDTDGLVEANYKPVNAIVAWSSITGKPVFATVSNTGDYNDLINIPDLSVYALISDVDNNYIINVTGNLDILATLRSYIDSFDIDDTHKKFRHISILNPDNFTLTLGSSTFTNDIEINGDIRMFNTDKMLVGNLLSLTSTGLTDTNYNISILPTTYSLDRLAKFSEVGGGSTAKEFIVLRLNNSTTNNKDYSVTTTKQQLSVYLKEKSAGFSITGNDITAPNKTAQYTIILGVTHFIASTSKQMFYSFEINSVEVGRVLGTSPSGSTIVDTVCNILNNVTITPNQIIKLWATMVSSSVTLSIWPTTYISEIKIIEN